MSKTYRDLKRKADRLAIAHSEGRHVPNGFPHFSSITGRCMCLDPCCNGVNGCKCKPCPCDPEKGHV